jgi:hypothetical protein
MACPLAMLERLTCYARLLKRPELNFWVHQITILEWGLLVPKGRQQLRTSFRNRAMEASQDLVLPSLIPKKVGLFNKML